MHIMRVNGLLITIGLPVHTIGLPCKSAYTPAYKELAKKAGSGLNRSSIAGTNKGCEISENSKVDTSINSSQMTHLRQKNNPLSSFDNSGLYNEAEGAPAHLQ